MLYYLEAFCSTACITLLLCCRCCLCLMQGQPQCEHTPRDCHILRDIVSSYAPTACGRKNTQHISQHNSAVMVNGVYSDIPSRQHACMAQASRSSALLLADHGRTHWLLHACVGCCCKPYFIAMQELGAMGTDHAPCEGWPDGPMYNATACT